MRWALLLALVGCADPTADPADNGSDSADAKADSFSATAPGRVLRLWLDHGVFPQTPAHPSALVYVPAHFDATPPLNLVVYLHGFNNCVDNVIRSTNGSCGSGTRNSYALAAQLEASQKNALLLLPEVAYDRASADPGQLAVDNGFQALLGEVLGKLGDVGNYTLNDVGTVIVASHSGGYKAAAGIANQGGVYVSEVWLLDSLYGETDQFDTWVTSDLDSIGAAARRFAAVYTATGGTLANSQAMATRAAGWVDASSLVDDRTTATLSTTAFQHGLVFKRTGLSHDGVPRYYFLKLLSSSSNL
jgi:hypothetical protein